jgi:hypothetical protein
VPASPAQPASSAPRAAAPAAPAAATPGRAADGPLAAYDAALSTTLAGVVRNGQAVGGDVAKVTAHVRGAYEKQRALLAVAARAKQPTNSELQALLQPVANEMMAAGQLADDRRSPAFQQLKVVAEALNGLSWLAYTGPACGGCCQEAWMCRDWGAAAGGAAGARAAARGCTGAVVSDWGSSLPPWAQMVA